MDARAIRTWFDVFDWAPADPSWAQRRRAIWAWAKLKKARRWARVLRFVPFVRMIAIGNALGYGNCREESDIDLVIVTAPQRLWTARLLAVALLRLFRQRPGEHDRDALCPSFFLTTEAMGLEGLQLNEGRGHEALPRDPYLLRWTTQLTVLVDRTGTYDAFWHANERWVRWWFPSAHPRGSHPRLNARTRVPDAIARCAEGTLGGRFGSRVERWARRFQWRRLPHIIQALANLDSRVVVTDDVLKLHVDDRRAGYRAAWIERLERYAR